MGRARKALGKQELRERVLVSGRKRVRKLLKGKELGAKGGRIFAEGGREDTSQLRVLSRETKPLYDRIGGNARVKLRYSIVDQCC